MFAVLVALAGAGTVPAVAVSQSAGDEQYVDPFEQGGSEDPATDNGTSGQESESSQGTGSSGTGNAAPAPPAPTAPTQAPATALARTGADLRLPLLVGVALLFSGALLFRWSRSAGS